MENRSSLGDWPKLLFVGVVGGLTMAAWNALPTWRSSSPSVTANTTADADDDLSDLDVPALTSESGDAQRPTDSAFAGDGDLTFLDDPSAEPPAEPHTEALDESLSTDFWGDESGFSGPPRSLVINPGRRRTSDPDELDTDSSPATRTSFAETPRDARGTADSAAVDSSHSPTVKLHRLVRRTSHESARATAADIPGPWAERLKRLEEEKELLTRRTVPPATQPAVRPAAARPSAYSRRPGDSQRALSAADPAVSPAGAEAPLESLNESAAPVIPAHAELPAGASRRIVEPVQHRMSQRRTLKPARLTGVIEVE